MSQKLVPFQLLVLHNQSMILAALTSFFPDKKDSPNKLRAVMEELVKYNTKIIQKGEM